MATISELKYACAGEKLQVRILRKWKPQPRHHETWYLAVDKFGDAIQILGQRTNQEYIEAVLAVDCKKHNGEAFVLLILADESGNEVVINLWKECIASPEKFSRDRLIPPPATTVAAVTNLKISSSDGILRFGSSSATHAYVNPPVPKTTQLINCFNGPSRPTCALSGIPTTINNIAGKTRDQLLKSHSKTTGAKYHRLNTASLSFQTDATLLQHLYLFPQYSKVKEMVKEKPTSTFGARKQDSDGFAGTTIIAQFQHSSLCNTASITFVSLANPSVPSCLLRKQNQHNILFGGLMNFGIEVCRFDDLFCTPYVR
ncbi:unnamed protein product [Lactuca virosa]|uniref:Uncharacterized protein n=1 Tax=Lactuca virosa TaxID=75947 RepID=A0AAU9NE88_9ASTR|nr:unnamed protein product [Lactuca virosa]